MGLNELDIIPKKSIIEEKEEEENINKKKFPNIEIIGIKAYKEFLDYIQQNYNLI